MADVCLWHYRVFSGNLVQKRTIADNKDALVCVWVSINVFYLWDHYGYSISVYVSAVFIVESVAALLYFGRAL